PRRAAKSGGRPPRARAADPARRARTSSPALQGVIVLKPFAMPMIGFPKSPSAKPTAGSMARLGVRWTPSVMTALLSLAMGGESPQNLLDRRLESVPLNFVGRDRGEGGVVALARPDPDHPLERLHEDL